MGVLKGTDVVSAVLPGKFSWVAPFFIAAGLLGSFVAALWGDGAFAV